MTTENDTMTTEKHGDVPNTSDATALDELKQMANVDRAKSVAASLHHPMLRGALLVEGPTAYGDPDITERLRKAADHASPDMHTAIVIIFQEARDVLSAVSDALSERPASLSPAQRTEELLAGRGYSDMDLMHHVLQLRSQARHLADTLLRDRGTPPAPRRAQAFDANPANEVYLTSITPQRG